MADFITEDQTFHKKTDFTKVKSTEIDLGLTPALSSNERKAEAQKAELAETLKAVQEAIRQGTDVSFVGQDEEAKRPVRTVADVLALISKYSGGGGGLSRSQVQALLDDLTAADIEVTPAGNLSSTDVQAALEELQTEIDGLSGGTDDQTAAEVPYDNMSSGLAATDTQAAVDEVEGRVDTLEGDSHTHANKTVLDNTTASYTTTEETKLAGIESGATADQIAAEVPYDNTSSGLAATDTQTAVDEVEGRVDTLEGDSHTHANKTVLDNTTASYTTAEETKLAGIEAGADVTDAANVDAAGATMNTDTDVSSNSYVLDEDDMASDDDTKVPTQQSVKAYVDANAGGGIDIANGVEFFEDFLWGRATTADSFDTDDSYIPNGWFLRNASTLADVLPVNSLDDRPGVVRLRTGTGSSGYCGISHSPHTVGAGPITIEMGVKSSTVLSNSSEDYHLFFGINHGPAFTGLASGSTGFVYDRQTRGNANWLALTDSGGAETETDTGIVYAVDTWYKFRIEVNADATEVKFYIDDSLVATHTSNIDTGVRQVVFNASKDNGTSSYSVYLDYMYFKQELTTAR